MTLRIERDHGMDPSGDEALAKTIGTEIKKQILVTAGVELVEYGSLPRSERKSKRVFDNREMD